MNVFVCTKVCQWNYVVGDMKCPWVPDRLEFLSSNCFSIECSTNLGVCPRRFFPSKWSKFLLSMLFIDNYSRLHTNQYLKKLLAIESLNWNVEHCYYTLFLIYINELPKTMITHGPIHRSTSKDTSSDVSSLISSKNNYN